MRHVGKYDFDVVVVEPAHVVVLSLVGARAAYEINEVCEMQFRAYCPVCEGDLSSYKIRVTDESGQSGELALLPDPEVKNAYITGVFELPTDKVSKSGYELELV